MCRCWQALFCWSVLVLLQTGRGEVTVGPPSNVLRKAAGTETSVVSYRPSSVEPNRDPPLVAVNGAKKSICIVGLKWTKAEGTVQTISATGVLVFDNPPLVLTARHSFLGAHVNLQDPQAKTKLKVRFDYFDDKAGWDADFSTSPDWIPVKTVYPEQPDPDTYLPTTTMPLLDYVVLQLEPVSGVNFAERKASVRLDWQTNQSALPPWSKVPVTQREDRPFTLHHGGALGMQISYLFPHESPLQAPYLGAYFDQILTYNNSIMPAQKGASGGGIFDGTGRLIGLISCGDRSATTPTHLIFAISVNVPFNVDASIGSSELCAATHLSASAPKKDIFSGLNRAIVSKLQVYGSGFSQANGYVGDQVPTSFPYRANHLGCLWLGLDNSDGEKPVACTFDLIGAAQAGKYKIAVDAMASMWCVSGTASCECRSKQTGGDCGGAIPTQNSLCDSRSDGTGARGALAKVKLVDAGVVKDIGEIYGADLADCSGGGCLHTSDVRQKVFSDNIVITKPQSARIQVTTSAMLNECGGGGGCALCPVNNRGAISIWNITAERTGDLPPEEVKPPPPVAESYGCSCYPKGHPYTLVIDRFVPFILLPNAGCNAYIDWGDNLCDYVYMQQAQNASNMQCKGVDEAKIGRWEIGTKYTHYYCKSGWYTIKGYAWGVDGCTPIKDYRVLVPNRYCSTAYDVEVAVASAGTAFSNKYATVTIDWGEGVGKQTYSLERGRTHTVSHAWGGSGSYNVVITVVPVYLNGTYVGGSKDEFTVTVTCPDGLSSSRVMERMMRPLAR